MEIFLAGRHLASAGLETVQVVRRLCQGLGHGVQWDQASGHLHIDPPGGSAPARPNWASPPRALGSAPFVPAFEPAALRRVAFPQPRTPQAVPLPFSWPMPARRPARAGVPQRAGALPRASGPQRSSGPQSTGAPPTSGIVR